MEIIEGLRLEMTCGACPEQYDAYDVQGEGESSIGYLRLRHGSFTVEYPDVGGELVYSAHPKGDGIFYKEERDYYLTAACKALRARIDKETTDEQ